MRLLGSRHRCAGVALPGESYADGGKGHTVDARDRGIAIRRSRRFAGSCCASGHSESHEHRHSGDCEHHQCHGSNGECDSAADAQVEGVSLRASAAYRTAPLRPAARIAYGHFWWLAIRPKIERQTVRATLRTLARRVGFKAHGGESVGVEHSGGGPYRHFAIYPRDTTRVR